ncbi:MAG: hypothetical protein AAGA56_31305, partial [Myxococcota bacterium]
DLLIVPVVGFAIALGATGCGKVKQCNDFIKEANESQTSFNSVASALGKKDEAKKVHDDIDAAIAKVEKVDLSDEKLVGFQKRWVDGLKGLNKTLEDVGDAAGGTDLKKMTDLQKKISKQTTDLTSLISEINGYCQGS